MAGTVSCRRCGRDAPALSGPTYPGELGEELERTICADCWAEWQHAEVIVINELRLNFMDPAAQPILIQHMKEFLSRPPGSGPGVPQDPEPR